VAELAPYQRALSARPCSFDPFLRKALQRVTRLFHPDYVMADDVPREFYVAFWGLPQVQK
jgi:hypothetical protein